MNVQNSDNMGRWERDILKIISFSQPFWIYIQESWNSQKKIQPIQLTFSFEKVLKPKVLLLLDFVANPANQYISTPKIYLKSDS